MMLDLRQHKTFAIPFLASILAMGLGACADDGSGDEGTLEAGSSGQGSTASTTIGTMTDSTTSWTTGSTTAGDSGTGSGSTSGTSTDDCLETGGTGGVDGIPGVNGSDCPAYIECVYSSCGTQVTQCFGDIANDMPGGQCESYFQCLKDCSCNSTDPNCANNCFSNTDVMCQACMTGLGLCAITNCQAVLEACDDGTGSDSTGGDTAGTSTGYFE